MPHLRFASQPDTAQRAALLSILRASPRLMQVLHGARALALPDCWLVSGAIYKQVWNHLTGRSELYGVKDNDLFYLDPDTSYHAEDKHISRAAKHLPGAPPVELRNQARVHLWYPQHFGQPYPQLRKSTDAVDLFASRNHAVAVQLGTDDQISLYAPYGLDDIFAFRLTPNTILDNRETHHRKAARQQALWPELTVIPWPGGQAQGTTACIP